ncbi:Imm50 family immunity protein [Gottfriedia sp. NPDC058432]|uniref:Imm50 family immunity protein n=1 Tax=Gottfriedia sp. NPDC058432 TaxID=3346497 RepID=UPI0036663D38
MWYLSLENNLFLTNLYNEVPELKNIKIENINIVDGGRKVTLCFDMPIYAENPPQKWVNLGNNTVWVELDFFDISELEIKSMKTLEKCDIEIKYVENSFIINITGTVDASMIAEYGYIQKVEGYINNLNLD